MVQHKNEKWFIRNGRTLCWRTFHCIVLIIYRDFYLHLHCPLLSYLCGFILKLYVVASPEFCLQGFLSGWTWFYHWRFSLHGACKVKPRTTKSTCCCFKPHMSSCKGAGELFQRCWRVNECTCPPRCQVWPGRSRWPACFDDWPTSAWCPALLLATWQFPLIADRRRWLLCLIGENVFHLNDFSLFCHLTLLRTWKNNSDTAEFHQH